MEKGLYQKKLINFFLIWLGVLLIIGFVSLFLPSFHPEINNKNNPPYFRWDSAWYESVSRDGYSFSEAGNSNIAFFPLYPHLVKVFDLVLGLGFNWTGLFLNVVLAFFAVRYLFELLLYDFEPRTSYIAVVLFMLFPSAFFLISVYAEALFVLLIILSFYFARKKMWFLTGVLSALAAITKPYGMLLVPALAVEFYLLNDKKLKCFREDKNWMYLLLPLIPISIFLLFNHIKFNYFFAFVEAQATWGRSFTWPWYTYFGYAHEIAKGNIWGASNSHYLINFIAVTLYLVLLPGIFRKCRLSYAAVTVLFALPALTSGTFTSFYRYLLPIFPLFAVLGTSFARYKMLLIIYAIMSFVCLLGLASLFVRWFPCF